MDTDQARALLPTLREDDDPKVAALAMLLTELVEERDKEDAKLHAAFANRV